MNEKALEKEIFKTGNEIYDLIEDNVPSVFETKTWAGKLLNWTMKREDFKIAIFRFIDALPSLRNDKDVSKLFFEYIREIDSPLPHFITEGFSKGGIIQAAIGRKIRDSIESLSKSFIGGSNYSAVLQTLRKIRESKRAFTVDLLGEAVLSEHESILYKNRYLELILKISEETSKYQRDGLLDYRKDVQILPADISLKISSFFSRIDVCNFKDSVEQIVSSLRDVFDLAIKHNTSVTLDMEKYSLKDITLSVFQKILYLYPEFHDVGIAIQAYTLDAEEDLKNIISIAENRKRKGNPALSVRLVKGAYYDYENVVHKRDGWPVPLFTEKNETDTNYEKLTRLLLDNSETINTAIASHNIRSIAHAIAYARYKKIEANRFEFQTIYGMAEPVKAALTKMGYRVREYVPVGEFLPGMSYFVRRLLENTSNESFLRDTFVEKKERKTLLQKPVSIFVEKKIFEVTEKKENDFTNMPLLDFTIFKNRELFQTAVEKTMHRKHYEISPVINGKKIETKLKFHSVNPANPEHIIGIVSAASRKEAQMAVESANKTYHNWSSFSPEERASICFRTAQIMRKKRFHLAALQLVEVGKNYHEADADVCEAVDFLEYYGRQAIALSKRKSLEQYPGESNYIDYIPKGVCAVISPWNFPLAITTGMTTAALVSGNTVILKPSSLSPVTAYVLYEIFKEAGLPDGVLNYLPGSGSNIGSFLSSHPDIDCIAFTGSKEAAIDIKKKASVVNNPKRGVKNVIAEMGGKNAIIVDDSADSDEAVSGIISSFLGFQGQKCSACSRLIIVENRYDEIIKRIIQVIKELPAGNPQNPANIIGPLIDKSAVQKVKKYISFGKKEAKLIFSNMKMPKEGFYVSPAVFTDVTSKARITREEIFGPVLSVMKAKDIDEAIQIANDSQYALTGGIYSRSPENIEKVRKYFKVGNLYINRKITGALVSRQPFGGFRMSGLGTKAGGSDYLKNFMNARVVSENTIRRGFAP
ncbi:MAG: proline dehydrogenase family protein [Spirochaetia bacterium]|nr:proline dehydrogenase family protein [Spirochaetia bacterium]